MWYVGQTDPSLFSPGVYDVQAFNAQDMYLNSTSGVIYQYTGTQWLPKGNIIGPQGSVGARGQRGSKWYSGTTSPGQASLSGVQSGDMYLETDNGNVYQSSGNSWFRISNIRGPQGEQGKNAVAVIIQSELESTDQLPPPDETDRTYAYIIDIDGVFHLFVITEDTETGSLVWTDMGPHGGTQIFVSGQSVDIWDADTKLDKITSTDGFARIYAVDGNNQTDYRLSSSTISTTVALRTSSGTLKGATPTADNDLTTKKYVDDALANMPTGGGGPTLHTMSIKLSSNWLDNANLAWTTKPGWGPPSQVPAVSIDNENRIITLSGAYTSAGWGKWTTDLKWPDNNFNYYFSMEPFCGNNVSGLSTADDRILCRSYFELTEILETNEYGVIYGGTLYFYA